MHQAVTGITGRRIEKGVVFRAADDAGQLVVAFSAAGPAEGRSPMDSNCSKCGTHLASPWRFCPDCGTAVVHEIQKPEHQHHPARGAFGGLYFGLVAAPILIIPGILLCLLGWGIFFGVPMIVLGILAPLLGPIVGMGEHRGKCPSCGTRMISIADSKEHECPVCNKKFAIEQHSPAGAR